MPDRPSAAPGGPPVTGPFVVRHPRVAGTLGALAIAFSGIFVRLADVAPTTAAVFRCAYAVPPLALLAWWERRRFGPQARRSVQLALVAGVFFGADLVLWHTAIGYVGAGLATVLGNLQVVVVGLVAWWLLGERPDRQVAAAVPLVLAGVVLIAGVGSETPYGADPALGVVFGLGTALAYAGFFLALRAGNTDHRRPAGPLLQATLAAAVFALVAGAALGEIDVVPAWPAHGWLLMLALGSQVVGWMLISVSLPRLPALVTAVMLLLQPAGAVVFSMILLGEAPSLPQLGGVLLVLSGVTAANLRRRRARPPPVGEAAGRPTDGSRDPDAQASGDSP